MSLLTVAWSLEPTRLRHTLVQPRVQVQRDEFVSQCTWRGQSGLLKERGLWKEGQSPIGLPKTKGGD